ncbi:hypothetical protein RCL_jg20679.t1 [Rhizophagus clarus]|nr:hypothetical protein RCL_jg20679.t1 [Rhizophagus clarus]
MCDLAMAVLQKMIMKKLIIKIWEKIMKMHEPKDSNNENKESENNKDELEEEKSREEDTGRMELNQSPIGYVTDW